MKPTPEQRVVCESTAHVMKIKAGAGTGKTTTLRGLAARHPRSRMLYLAFNKAIKEEAAGKFGSHVHAMTAHGMAFGAIGRDYSNEPDKLLSGDLKPHHVLPVIQKGLAGIPAALHNLYAGRVIEAIKAFFVSADETAGPQHLTVSMAAAEKKYFNPAQILADADVVLTSMADLKGRVPITHDGYLKLFALEKPTLPCDFLLLDEAQDTNPVLQGLVAAQPCRRAYVGDEHQAIYAFRGATNAMATLAADAEYALTGSFRFGPAIADIANSILRAKGENRLQLQGLGPASQVVSGGSVRPHQPHAYISRSNAMSFARAVEAVEGRQPFAFVGPLYSYRFDLIEQTYELSCHRQPRDPFLRAFDTFEQLQEYAEALNDREILARCKLVERYGSKLPGLLERITQAAGTYPSRGAPGLVLTTAHRSKGLEFDTVKLADDFTDFKNEDGEWEDLTEASAQTIEEINLLYVAATRAKTTLETNDKLMEFIGQRLPAQLKLWEKKHAQRLAGELDAGLPAPAGGARARL